MIIEYDRSANLSAEQQLRSLQESVQRAFDEITTAYKDDLSTSSGELYTTINLFRKDYAYFNQITTEKLDADRAYINQLFAKDVTIEETLEAHAGRFEDLEADYAEIDALVVSHTASINQLTAEDVTINNSLRALTGRIGTIEANYITSEQVEAAYLKVGLANLDTANIDKAKVGQMFANVGLIDRATIVDGHVTGYLDSVSINANSITAGTLTTNRLLLAGDTGSILYELNNLGQLVSQNVNTLDGYVLTPRTINADRIVASSITANELDVASVTAATVTASNIMALNLEAYDLSAWQATIGGFHIGEAALYSPVEQYLWDPVLLEESEQLERSAMNENLDLSEDTSTWLYDDLTGNEMAALNVEYDLSEPTDAWMTTVTYPEYRELCLLNDIDPELYSSVYLGTDAIGLGDNFYVDIDGNMEAKNVDITGHIVATSGEISGSLLVGRIADPNENTVFNLTTGNFKMSKGSIDLGDGNFKVTSNGYMDVKRGRIRLGLMDDNYTYNFQLTDTGMLSMRHGTIELGNDRQFVVEDNGYLTSKAGFIGGFTIGETGLRMGQQYTSNWIYLGQSGIQAGTTFKVDRAGKLTASAGTIGSFIIGETGMRRNEANEYGYVYLGEDGLKVGSYFSVDPWGELHAGAWEIDDDSIHSDFGIYRAYIQEPLGYDFWVYSTQQLVNGSYRATFNVNANGVLNVNPALGGVEFRVDASSISADTARAYIHVNSDNIKQSAREIGLSASSTVSLYAGNYDVTVTSSSVLMRNPNSSYGVSVYSSSMEFNGSHIYFPSLLSISSNYGYLCLDTDGMVRYLTNSSSRKVKHDVKLVADENLDPARLYDAEVVQFKYNDDYLEDDDPNRGRDLVGFIVEDLDEVYPVAVSRNDPEESKTWTWEPTRLLPAMLKLIQDQHKDIEAMRAEITEMRRETKLC